MRRPSSSTLFPTRRSSDLITGVSYNSTASLERRLGSLHLPVGENPTTVQFLDALRGARLEVRSGSANVSGRLLSIEDRKSTRLNSSHVEKSYAVFCLKKKI